MNYETQKFSKTQVDKAGQILANQNAANADTNSADAVLSNWRACHIYPMNTFRSTLGKRLGRLSLEINIAQRLKRRESIIDKLRIDRSMRLTQMQDIGGLRVVLPNIRDLRALESVYSRKPTKQFPHLSRPSHDYIECPRDDDGYRSLHLIYRYQKSIEPKVYNGLLVELQLRTRLQHHWATAVETMETFLRLPIKSRRRDPESEWVAFFRIVSSAFAYIEKLPRVPRYAHWSQKETFEKVVAMDSQLHVLEQLRGYRLAADAVTKRKDKNAEYHIILLNYEKRTVSLFSFSKEALSVAQNKYEELEQQAKNVAPIDSVLVSVNSISNLKRDYPNFFLDTSLFIDAVKKEIISKVKV